MALLRRSARLDCDRTARICRETSTRGEKPCGSLKGNMNQKTAAAFVLLAASEWAQGQKATPKPYQGQATSTFSTSTKEKEQVIEISNVAYEVTGTAIPGRASDERLVLRKTTRTKYIVDEIGEEATTTVEAWPLGT